MFLCAVVKPHFNPCSNSWWDGKLGIWPIGDWELVKQKLKNRPKGTLVWKNKIVTKEVYHDLLITKLIPSILEKWPRGDRLSRKIFIQQDGAKNHISCNNKLFNNALVKNSINTTLYTQAVNSPDANLLDLGFFRAIQSFNDAAPKNEEELIEAVSAAYDKYPRHKINQTWLTLQCCFNQIIMHHGDNDYNIDHIGKEQLEQNGNLLEVMDVVEDVANIHNYNVTDDDESVNNNMDDENTIIYT